MIISGHVTADKLPEKAAESIIQVSALKKNGDRVGVKMLHGEFLYLFTVFSTFKCNFTIGLLFHKV